MSARPAARQWLVELMGDEAALSRLAEVEWAGPVRVMRYGGRVVLWSAEFDALANPDDVVAAAEPIVDSVNMAARAILHAVFDIDIDAVRVRDSGSRFVYRETRDELEALDDAIVVGDGATLELGPDMAARDAALGAQLALTNPDVARCLRLLAGNLTWGRLRNILDLVTAEVPRSEIVQRGWAPPGAIARFEETANDPRLAGDDAAHGTPVNPRRRPSSDPMLKPQARELMHGLARAWLRWIATGRPRA